MTEVAVKIGTEIGHLQDVLNEVLANEWEAQGHHMTGKVVKEIIYKVKQETDKIILSGFMYPYGNIIAAGTKKDKIPFSPRGMGFKPSGAGTSLYIAALQNYAKNRMGINDAKKSLSVAFAIATTQKKYGMPTPASVFYSSTGKRTDWVEEAFKNNEEKITEAIRNLGQYVVSANFDALISQWQIMLNEN